MNLIVLESNFQKQFNSITLDSLMNLYHANFVKFNRLIDPNLLQKNQSLISKKTTPLIGIELLDKAKYTTTLKMNYLFANETCQTPNAEIRIYHDARQVEALKMINQSRISSFFSLTYHQSLSNIEARWQLNNFLHKWLQYCLENYYEISDEH